MASTDLVRQSSVYSRATISERAHYAHELAGAGALLPEHLRGGMARDPQTQQMVQVGAVGKVFMIAETGDMLGIHPMAALTGVHIIEGKPAISANLMSGLVRNAGHKLRVKVEGKLDDDTLSATATLIRRDDEDYPFVVTWNLERAKRALLWPGKDRSNWQKYPEAMLKARAISEVIREGASDVLIGGNVYTPEELGIDTNEDGEPIEMQQVPDMPVPSQGGTRQPAPAQPPVVPKEQPPIVDEQTGETGDDTPDYPARLEALTTYQESIDLYRLAESRGDLQLEVTYGRQRKPRPLEEQIREIGTKLKEAEIEQARAAQARAAAAAEGPGEEDAVIVGEPMDDDTPMAMGGQ